MTQSQFSIWISRKLCPNISYGFIFIAMHFESEEDIEIPLTHLIKVKLCISRSEELFVLLLNFRDPKPPKHDLKLNVSMSSEAILTNGWPTPNRGKEDITNSDT